MTLILLILKSGFLACLSLTKKDNKPMRNKSMRKSAVLVAFVTAASFTLMTGFVSAATLIMGGASFATTEGNVTYSGNGIISTSALTSQYQVVASHLAGQGLIAGMQITGVRTRLDGGVTMVGDRTTSDLEIRMAQAVNAIGSMSSTLSSNMNNPVLLHDGAFTYDDALMPGGASPNAYGQLIPFSTPYTYQGGDLIFMVTRPGITGGGDVNTDAFGGDGTVVRQMRFLTFQSNFGVSANTFELFQFEFGAVPEPSHALLLAGFLSVALRRKR